MESNHSIYKIILLSAIWRPDAHSDRKQNEEDCGERIQAQVAQRHPQQVLHLLLIQRRRIQEEEEEEKEVEEEEGQGGVGWEGGEKQEAEEEEKIVLIRLVRWGKTEKKI